MIRRQGMTAYKMAGRGMLLAALGSTGALGLAADTAATPAETRGGNLLLNPTFEFHSFAGHRLGKAEGYSSGYVAFWNCDAYGDVQVVREAHAPADVQPAVSVGNLVRIGPGKSLRQFIAVPEGRLAHGTSVVLTVYGSQSAAGALRARLRTLKLDSEDGTWSPSEFGMADKRSFPRHSRGELVCAAQVEASSDQAGRVALATAPLVIEGRFHANSPDTSYSQDVNTVAVEVELANSAADAPVWVWWPTLTPGAQAAWRLPAEQQPYPYYRHIPRTLQKLWKGEALHILAMGSSIDRGSANPPMYLYDETPGSATFKQPLSDRVFEPDRVKRPDLAGYIGWWQHYFCYTGRLRLELLRKFDLPVDRICLNLMACDGSCVGEAHSGLAAYCSLSLPPAPNENGQGEGKSWKELHPGLFSRPEGPRPDLVIFGSGANEKTDTPNEVAVFEGTIRWIQRHYPDTEFLFCMFQNAGGYTPNADDLRALALRYQIPVLDYGKLSDDLTRWCNRYALVPNDGHPQAAAHYLWFKVLERAFECWDPILPGIAQRQLPERLHPNTYGWEGDMVTLTQGDARINGNMVLFEDTALNCWGSVADDKPIPWVDGQKQASRRSQPGRDLRNSLFRHGDSRLGDRHILEIEGPEAKLTAVDLKVCPNRRFIPVDSPAWERQGLEVKEFVSAWGAPYGKQRVDLPVGASLTVAAVGSDLSIAFVDQPEGGVLKVEVDGQSSADLATNTAYTDRSGKVHYLENRRGILGLAYGLHRITLTATGAPVSVLGLFAYDSRPNRDQERVLRGLASPGEVLSFSAPFKARPLVYCTGGLGVEPRDIEADAVRFSGSGPGFYEIVGE
jgi:hypothetical protein